MNATVTLDGLEQPSIPRFVVGIDLGTTNCAVAYVDTLAKNHAVQVFPVEQLVDWQTIERRTTLPSFHYQWTDVEAIQLKATPRSSSSSQNYCVGVYARNRGVQSPGRHISSAKSWLCHSGVDRTASILPWHGDPDADRLSPVVASSRYLTHIHQTWNATYPAHPLSTCEVVITLPASFDEVARELTIEAAKLAGLPRIVLIEEPQAAFYAWLSRHEKDWQTIVQSGQSVLICDIGGGTTDFTLIRVREDDHHKDDGHKGDGHKGDGHKVALHRVAVGQHLMLGGDNLDLALAKAVETQSSHRSPSGELENSQDQSGAPLGERRPLERPQEQQPLNPAEFDLLRLQCRAAKETLLGNSNPTHCIVSIAGKGSRLIGNVRCFEISHELAERTLLDGFFPQVELESVPHESQGGLFEFGLPYAADPAITRHLAQFLWQHRWDGRPETAKTTMSDRIAARPDWILFNGGVLESPQIRERLRKQIENWFQDENAYSEIGELESSQLDLAVAIGAAYFGLVRRGEGVRINARLARAYYLQVATDPPMALCIMPGDAVPLDRFKLTGHPFELEIGRPIQFPILVSSTHLVHRADELLPIDLDHMRPIPPIQTVLESSRYRHAMRVPVVLETELTEIGTLDLALVTSGGSDDRSQDPSSTMRWQLAFDLRSTVETDRDAHQGHLEQTGIVDSLIVNQANLLIRETFEPKAPLDAAKSLAKRLANELGIVRHDWKPSLLRSMWQTLIDCDPNQKRHAITESRWLNLLGYCLRPGYGYAADDWRVAMTWRLVQGKLKHASNAAEAMVLWRRIAGGFTMGQQRALYQEIQSRVREILENGGRVHLANQNAMELLRLVGSLELLGAREKKLLGSLAIKAFQRSKMVAFLDATLWMLGRLGARSLVYGPANDVLNSDLIEGWVMSLTEVPQPLPSHQLALMQLTRRTGDRYRDVPVAIRELALQTLQQWNAPASYLRLVSEVTELNSEQKEAIIGESLPLGIRLRR